MGLTYYTISVRSDTFFFSSVLSYTFIRMFLGICMCILGGGGGGGAGRGGAGANQRYSLERTQA